MVAGSLCRGRSRRFLFYCGFFFFLSFGVFFIMWALLQWGLEMETEERMEENKTIKKKIEK
jgi:hypothetical protein